MRQVSARRFSRVPQSAAALLIFLLAACTTPIGVWQAGSDSTNRTLAANLLSTGKLSAFTQNVLHLHALSAADDEEALSALEALHEAAARDDFPPAELFALSELAFQQAERRKEVAYYLATAVYSYAYLFPDARPADRPDGFDPKLRWAADLYNRAVTSAFASEDGAGFEPRPLDLELPFGTMSVKFDQSQLNWHDRRLVEFVPVADLEIRGLRTRYRLPGLGAPLAAGTVVSGAAETGFQVGRRLKIPVTALLRIEKAREGLRSGAVAAELELYPQDAGDTVEIAGQAVPLEAEPSAVLAYSLSDPEAWNAGLRGFLVGTLMQSNPTRLAALQPYAPGRIPVIFVHGTASVAARWAQMVNDLTGDPLIRNRFQFWFFGYESGNPIPYSALLFREALTDAMQKLDPSGMDPALRQAIVIGHSQGGLLAKMIAIDSGTTIWDELSQEPLDELRLTPATHDLLERMLFVKPLPFVRRAIFIATPQRGSYVAGWSLAHLLGRLVKLPLDLVSGAGEFLKLQTDQLRFDPATTHFGSVYGMTPNSPFIRALSKIRLSPDVAAHSIIAVQGDGPIESGGDGVVKYASAHIEEAQSEFVVRSGHSCQADPRTISEVRRILLLHAAESCAREHVACPASLDRVAAAAQ
jgi:pimeloyl-ACP methyl ester carboxylesterase